MFPRQLEQLAHDRAGELRAEPPFQRKHGRRSARQPIRHQTGWALVALGLRIAGSASGPGLGTPP